MTTNPTQPDAVPLLTANHAAGIRAYGLPAINSVSAHEEIKAIADGRAVVVSAAELAEAKNELAWLTVSEHGHPADGRYVALYRDGSHLIVSMCDYGDWEFFDADEVRDDADEDGMVHGYGWTESITDFGDDGYLHMREVVAYQARNYAFSTPEMKALRARLTTGAAGNG